MMKSVKYGISLSLGYVAVIAVIIAVAMSIDYLTGERDLLSYFRGPYIIAWSTGFVSAFVCGYLWPSLLSKSITKYSKIIGDSSQKSVLEISRGKLLQQYFFNISWICLASALLLIKTMEEYPLLICVLMGCGFTFLFLYLKQRKIYENV